MSFNVELQEVPRRRTPDDSVVTTRSDIRSLRRNLRLVSAVLDELIG
jgi:hypothetical protein